MSDTQEVGGAVTDDKNGDNSPEAMVANPAQNSRKNLSKKRGRSRKKSK